MIPSVSLSKVLVEACEHDGYHLRILDKTVILPMSRLLSCNEVGKYIYDWDEGPPPVRGGTYDLVVMAGWARENRLDSSHYDVRATFMAEGGRKTPPNQKWYTPNTIAEDRMWSIGMVFQDPVEFGVPVKASLQFFTYIPTSILPIGTVLPITEGQNKVGDMVIQ